MVRIMRHPPAAVPAAMVIAQAILTHTAISNFGVRRNSSHEGRSLNASVFVEAVKRARAMMPIVFWASFVPWLKLIQAELNHWRTLKVLLTGAGLAPLRQKSRMPMRT